MRRLLIASVLFFSSLQADTKLQFIPNIPVEQTITIDIDMHQTLPGFKMDANSKQDLKSTLKILSEQSDVPITQGPVDLIYTLKDINVEMTINDKQINYHSKDPAQSVETAQIAKMIDRPVRLQLDEKFQLNTESPDLKKVIKEFPQLQKVNFDKIIQEMFVYLFGFANKNLKPGASYTVNLANELLPGMPAAVTYTIDKIENDTVYATISGSIAVADKVLENKLLVGEKEEELLLNVKGKISGQGQWNQNNALLNLIDTHFKASGNIKINGLEWPFNFKGKITVNGQLVK